MSTKLTPGQQDRTSPTSRLPTSQLVGLSVSALLAAGSTGWLVYYYLRQRQHEAAHGKPQHAKRKRGSKRSTVATTTTTTTAPEQVQLRGYTNLGNTCFLNALLQALASQPQFLNCLQRHVQLTGSSEPSAHSSSTILPSTHAGFKSSPLIASLYNTLLHSSGSSSSSPQLGTGANIQQFYKTLVQCAPQFRGFAQNDAHELYVALLELVERAINEADVQLRQPASLADVLHCLAASAEPAAQLPPSRARTTPRLPFDGQTISLLQCSVCGHASTLRTTNFNCLSLSLPYTQHISACSLQQLLGAYVARDNVSDVKCSCCTASATHQHYYNQLKQHVQQQDAMNQRDWQKQLQTLKAAVIHWRRQQAKYSASATATDELLIDKKSIGSNGHHANGIAKHDDKVKAEKSSPSVVRQLIESTPMVTTDVDVTPAATNASHAPATAVQPPPAPEATVRRMFYKSLVISQLPQCLMLHINRLMGDMKLETYVAFPLQINMTPFCADANIHFADRVVSSEQDSVEAMLRTYMQSQSSQQPPLIYQLTAVVVHLGRSGSGHYVTYRRHSKYQPATDAMQTVPAAADATWSMISDSSVRSNVEVDEVRRANAYLLFYHRLGQ